MVHVPPVARLVSALLAFLAVPAFAQNLTVTNANLQGWTLPSGDAAPVGSLPPPKTFLGAGFETPPAGVGSVHFSVGSDGGDNAQARHTAYNGTRIDALTALSYATFTEVDGSGSQSPYLLFNVDTDGNLATADVQVWFFEPLYQGAAFFPANPQGPLAADTWQTWNALAGGWYTSGGLAGSGPGANVKSISQLLAAAPNATLATTAAGAVRIVTGFGAGAWNNFLGAADNFRIATAGFDTTYNFEPDPLATVTVTPSQLENWTLVTTNDNLGVFGASSTIVTGPGTPPMGTGSLQLAVGTDGADSAEARSTRFDGSFLRDLTELNYRAYHQSGGAGTGQMPYIILRVDYDNNGTQDDLLFYEPLYQTGVFCPSNPQPAPTTGAWQTWEAANGCWWSLNNTAGAGPGANVKTLAQILAVEPDARLNTGTAGGATRIVAGFGAGAWDNFIGNVDAFNISFNPARTIYDFDPDPTISIADLALNEGNAGNTAFNFVVTLNKPVSYTVTVQYATADNTATVADGDYTAVPLTTITFVPNDTSELALVNVVGDMKFEPTETFFVNLSNPSVGATISDAQAIGTITNDDAQPTISISDVTLNEGNGGTTNFVFNVTLSNPSAQTITVDYTTAPNTALAGSDYATTSGTLTFNPLVVAQPITVVVTGDTVFEATETFFVNLTNPTNATILDAQGLGTITNDDSQPTISINDVTLAEGNAGTTNFVFDVTLSNPTDATVTVDFATAAGTATAGTDYTTTSGTLTFNPLVTLQQVTVTVAGDVVFEPNETFFVNLTNPTQATILDNQGLGTITNDEGQPTITISDVTLAEGNAGTTAFTFNVTLSGASASTITVDYATAPNTATAGTDYTTTSGTLTFNPLVTTQPITVNVIGDVVFEATETFFVNLTNATNATITDAQGLGTITNDDPQPTITINDVTLNEGNAGTTVFTFNVTLSGPSASTITVDYTTAPNSATAGTDYTTTSGTLTFNPLVTTQPITVNVIGDAVFEPTETFFVNLTNPTNATTLDSQGLGTITNDDAQPTITINDVTLNEGNAGTTAFTFTVTLSNPSASTITVDYATAPNTAAAGTDYTTTSGTLTFNPLVTAQPITVNVIGDLVVEGTESFFVNLTNATNATITDAQGIGTITNDDGLPTITIDDVTQNEGNAGTTAFTFTVTLSAPSASTVTVDYATAPGTATAGVDYTSASGTLTFNPLVTTQPITINVLGETAFEAAETFFVNLTNPTNATIADNQGVGTITNDDGPVADISITKTGPATVSAGQNVNYTITVSNAGPQIASNVVVTDIIPASTTFISATPSQGTCSGTTTVTCTLGAVGVGANATISLVVRAPMTNATISNTATATNTPETDPTPGNNAGTALANVMAEIPTLSEWALIALAMALAAFAAMKVK